MTANELLFLMIRKSGSVKPSDVLVRSSKRSYLAVSFDMHGNSCDSRNAIRKNFGCIKLSEFAKYIVKHNLGNYKVYSEDYYVPELNWREVLAGNVEFNSVFKEVIIL